MGHEALGEPLFRADRQAEWISLGIGVPLEHPDLPDHQLTSAGDGDWSVRPWPL